jgi:N-acetylneuraminic acid mutarotase
MPWAAQEIYCTLFKGEVLVAGGLYGVPREDRRFSIGVLDRTALYDPRRDRWREGPRLPTPRHHPSFATVGDRAYAVGGFVTEGKKQWTATAEVLSFDGRGWTPVAPIPEPQNETVALALGGRIHVVTGRSPSHTANGQWGDQRDSAAHQVYDARANRWDDARPAPTARNSAAGAVIGGKLYVVGGRTVQGGNLDVLERYDPKADAWETLRPMPQASGGLAAAALNGRLYAFGGEYFDRNGGGVYEATWEYDPPTDQWRAVAPMRTPRHGLAGIAVNGSIFSIGGAVRASAEGTTAVVEAFTPEGVSAS